MGAWEHGVGSRGAWGGEHGSMRAWEHGQGSMGAWGGEHGSMGAWGGEHGSTGAWGGEHGSMGAWGGEHGSMGSMGKGAWEHGEGHCRLVRRRAGAHCHRRRPPIGERARSRSSDRFHWHPSPLWSETGSCHRLARTHTSREHRGSAACGWLVQRREAAAVPSAAVPSATQHACGAAPALARQGRRAISGGARLTAETGPLAPPPRRHRY